MAGSASLGCGGALALAEVWEQLRTLASDFPVRQPSSEGGLDSNRGKEEDGKLANGQELASGQFCFVPWVKASYGAAGLRLLFKQCAGFCVFPFT